MLFLMLGNSQVVSKVAVKTLKQLKLIFSVEFRSRSLTKKKMLVTKHTLVFSDFLLPTNHGMIKILKAEEKLEKFTLFV